jgi:hypothetical protein
MLECLIIGDSIAVGTKMFAPKECVSYAKGGYNTWQWNKKWGSYKLEAGRLIISLGTNDHKYVNTKRELEKIRARVHCAQGYKCSVTWIMPPCNKKFCKPKVNQAVKLVAEKHGDRIIGTNRVQPDGIHPSWRGYKDLVEQSK